MNIYESDKLLAEYLLFHYGAPEEILPYDFGPQSALDFAVRCVSLGVDASRVPAQAAALDLGCAVGRSSFELARFCQRVVGIDFSARFVAAARHLGEHGALGYSRLDEGALSTPLVAAVSAEIGRERVRFETGDAMDLRGDLGAFDVVLLANLIDRLTHPAHCLARLPALVKGGGQLVITSPYTWMEEFTPRENWLGTHSGIATGRTLEALTKILEPHFERVATLDLPFLIREHARKFQWSVAQCTRWIRR